MGSKYNFILRIIRSTSSSTGIQRGILTMLILSNLLLFSGMSWNTSVLSTDDNQLPVSSNKIKFGSYNIGDEESFSVWNFHTQEKNSVTATCRAIGNESYVFLDNNIPLGTNYTTISEKVDEYMIPILSANFATPPDVDGNDRVIILYTPINGAGGYFSPSDSYTGEIVYINGENGALREDTVIHELQHLVNHGYDSQETIWFNEGCSMFSEFLLDYAEGFSEPHSLYYPHDISLLFWDYDNAGLGSDYKAALTFIAYLQDQYGAQNLSDIYHAESGGNKLQSSTAIMHIVNQYFPDLTFEKLYMNFIKATILDDKYEGEKRELYYDKYISKPGPLRFPAGGVYQQEYPYDSTAKIVPWATKIIQFRDFPDPNNVTVSVTIPEESRDHLFGVSIIKENQSLNYTDSDHQTYILSPENSSAGLHLTLNATAEGFDHFYLTLSHLDGGEGGYYWDIPSSEQNIKVSLQVFAGESDDDQSSVTSDGKTTSAVSILYVLLFSISIVLVRKRYLR